MFEELLWKSDYQINQLTRIHKSLAGFALPQDMIPLSGKFKKFDELLPKLKEEGHRVLIFSQFTMILDIMEEYLTMRRHSFLRYSFDLRFLNFLAGTQFEFKFELIF